MDGCLGCVLQGTEYWSGEGASSCDLCKSRYYMNENGDCVNCFELFEDSTKDHMGVDCSQPGNQLGERMCDYDLEIGIDQR